ncbi:hypothetical protein KSS87_001437 [Heliosperma pusillum]|nr:hypothetical protein KSS87_001437 [Heliosperma pusillum]
MISPSIKHVTYGITHHLVRCRRRRQRTIPNTLTSTTTDTFPTTITTASSPLTLPSTCRCCLSNRNISITLVQLNGGTKETTGRSLTKDCIIING